MIQPLRIFPGQPILAPSKPGGAKPGHKGHFRKASKAAAGSLSQVQVIARFDAKAVCTGPCRSLREAVTQDPAFVSANPVFSAVTQPSGETYPAPGFAASFSQLERSRVIAAPRLGEHTEQELAEVLGLPGLGIAGLHDRGIIAGVGKSL